MGTHFDNWKAEKNAKIDMILGEELTNDMFIDELRQLSGSVYRIHNGWNVRDTETLSNKSETRIAGGTLSGAYLHNRTIFVELNHVDDRSEKFSTDAIKKITRNDNNFYVIYNDDSYFRISVE